MQITADIKTEREAENLPAAEPVERELWRVALQKA